MNVEYLYIKNGDAVDQIGRISAAGFSVEPNGPDAFISDFLSSVGDDQVTVISRGRRKAKLEVRNICAITLDGGAGFIEKLWKRPLTAAVIAGRIWSSRPRRILCGSTGSQLLVAWIGARTLGCSIVHSRHNSLRVPGKGPVNRIRRALEVFVLAKLDGIVVHGPFLRDQIVECGVEEDRVQEFEVDFPLRPLLRQRSVRPTLLFVGRIERGKGVFDLVNAVQPILSRVDDLELHFIGSGMAFEQLAVKVAETADSDRIFLHGPLPHPDVLRKIQSAYTVVTPTRTEFPEGRCMVVLESLAAGVPVVAPNHGPFPYAITPDVNGLLFSSDDARALRECLLRILLEKGLLERLEAGAAASAAELQDSRKLFSTAVDAAFVAAEDRNR